MQKEKTVKASGLTGCTNYDKTDISSLLQEFWPKKTDGFEIISEFLKNYASFFWRVWTIWTLFDNF